MQRSCIIFGLFAIAALSWSNGAFAAGTRIWTGIHSSDWDDSRNWENGILPTVHDVVKIPPKTPFSVEIAVGQREIFKLVMKENTIKVINGTLSVKNMTSLEEAKIIGKPDAAGNPILESGSILVKNIKNPVFQSIELGVGVKVKTGTMEVDSALGFGGDVILDLKTINLTPVGPNIRTIFQNSFEGHPKIIVREPREVLFSTGREEKVDVENRGGTFELNGVIKGKYDDTGNPASKLKGFGVFEGALYNGNGIISPSGVGPIGTLGFTQGEFGSSGILDMNIQDTFYDQIISDNLYLSGGLKLSLENSNYSYSNGTTFRLIEGSLESQFDYILLEADNTAYDGLSFSYILPSQRWETGINDYSQYLVFEGGLLTIQEVPAPIPFLGIAAAYRFSRKLKNVTKKLRVLRTKSYH
jgi:hypothetical protein